MNEDDTQEWMEKDEQPELPDQDTIALVKQDDDDGGTEQGLNTMERMS